MGLIRCSSGFAGCHANRSRDVEGESVEVVLETTDCEGFTSRRACMIVDAERTRDVDCGLGVSHLESAWKVEMFALSIVVGLRVAKWT